ncbi:MAG: hypothetical protein PF518_14680, partial [Spirochaetaceae bacterium]|nr:hypothetical protein [Spirochaetaceae bacterium]
NELLLSFSPLEHMRSINLIFESKENSTTSNIIMKAGDSIEYSIKSRRGYNSYWIYGNIVDPPLNNLSIITVNTPLVKVFFKQDNEDGNAIPVDLEEFINWKFDLWRQKDYEVFQWDLFPDIFLIDTESYDIQSKFFKRLAFFTEKKMAVGELLSDEELKPLHGWNAHDYKADDLARFFNEADTLGIILNEYELLLKEILLENQVLKITSGRVRPLKGGILSISRESNARLRWLFLTHESYHGIFFSSKEYESAVFEIWNNLPEEQKDFWRIFLDLYGYNINDEYLLINEFQAYLMQQDTSLTDSYFRSKIEWMISIRPYLKKQLENRNTFFKNALAVEESAYSLLGIKAGDLVLKRKK